MNYNNDNFEATCGKIYRKGMTVATIMTLVYTALKLVSISITNLGNFDFKQFIIEFVMVAYVVAVGILSIIKFQGGTGEDTDHNVFKFYSRALNLYVALYAVVNILVLPLITVNTFSLATVIAVTFVYLYYNLKMNGIKINYSIIDHDNKKYYSKVYFRIGMIAVLFLAISIVSGSVWGILKNDSQLFIKYLTNGFEIAVTLCLLYYIVSLAEKLDYDDNRPVLLTRSVKALGIALLVASIANIVLSLISGILTLMTWNDIPNINILNLIVNSMNSISSILSNISKASLFMLICRFAISLADNKLLKFLKIRVGTYLIGNLVGGFTSSIRTILRFYKINEMIPLYDTITMGLTFAYSLITTVIIVWTTIILVKKYNCSKYFYLLPIVNVSNKVVSFYALFIGIVYDVIPLLLVILSSILPIINIIVVYNELKKRDEQALLAGSEAVVADDTVDIEDQAEETENTDE